MSSTNKTSNLGLNLWSVTDPVVHSDFNADNEKIDLAVQTTNDKFTAKIENLDSRIAGQISALSENLEAELGKRLKIVSGSYIGTGTYGNQSPITIYTGIIPFIFILGTTNPSTAQSIGNVVTDLQVVVPWSNYFNMNSSRNSNDATIREWENDRITWTSSRDARSAANTSGDVYSYIIIGSDD